MKSLFLTWIINSTLIDGWSIILIECKLCQRTSWYHDAPEPHRSRPAEANKEVLCTDPCNPTGSVKVLQFSGGYCRWTWALQGLSVKISAGCHNCITLAHPRPHPNRHNQRGQVRSAGIGLSSMVFMIFVWVFTPSQPLLHVWLPSQHWSLSISWALPSPNIRLGSATSLFIHRAWRATRPIILINIFNVQLLLCYCTRKIVSLMHF